MILPLSALDLAVFFRCLGFTLLMPAGPGISHLHKKIAGSFLLYLAAAPGVRAGFAVPADPSYTGEVLAGVLTGVPVLLLVTGAKMFGEIFDTARGQNIALMYDPLGGGQASLFSKMFRLGTIYWILASGMAAEAVTALFKSFAVLAPGSVHPLLFAGAGVKLMLLTIFVLKQVFTLAVPAGLVFFLIDLSFGFLSKTLPRLEVYTNAFQVKAAFGIGLLYLMYHSGALVKTCEALGSAGLQMLGGSGV